MRSFIAALALCLSCGTPTIAQDAPADQSYQTLDAWLRIAETERRCGSLFYFELRVIEKSVGDSMSQTPETKAAYAAAGTAQFNEKFKAQTAMLNARRQAAREATLTSECGGYANPDLASARRFYFSDFLKLSVMINQEKSYEQLTDAQRSALSGIFQLVKQAYGEQFETVLNQKVAELNATPPKAGTSLPVMLPFINDLVWEQQVFERGHKTAMHSTEPGWLEFRKDGVTNSVYGKFGKPQRQFLRFDEDVMIPAHIASGQTKDGQIAYVINFETKAIADTVDDVKATIFSQNREQLGEWDQDDWRTRSTAYQSRRDETDACPGHVCLIFPDALSQRIRTRQQAGKNAYPYEIYIAGEKLHPAPMDAPKSQRKRFTPPSLILAGSGN